VSRRRFPKLVLTVMDEVAAHTATGSGAVIAALGWLAGRVLRLAPESLLGRVVPPAMRFSAGQIPPPPVPPDGAVRLLVAPVNWAGQGRQWARAVQEFLPGVGALNMAYRLPSDFAFPADSVVPAGVYVLSRRWQRAQFAAVRGGFTHVLIEAERQPFGAVLDESVRYQVDRLRRAGIRVAMVCHGSDIRLPRRHAANNPDSPFHRSILAGTAQLEGDVRRNRALLTRLGLPVFVSTPDLLLDVPEATWLPVVIEVDAWATTSAPLTARVPVVAHAPSRGPIKGSDLVDPILRRLDAEGLVSYRRVEGVPAEQMPGVYRDADIVLDQFRIGDYGVAACEAMAAGRVVIAHVSEHSRGVVLAETGLHLPIVEATADELEGVIRSILTDRARYRRLAATGVEFAREVHSGQRSARLLSEFLGIDS
jgi:hypothetical protein